MNRTVGAYPELLPLAARLARLHGCGTIIGLGPASWAETAVRYPDLDLIEVRSGPSLPDDRRSVWSHRQVRWDPAPGGQLPVDLSTLIQSVVLCTALDGSADERASAVSGLRSLLEFAPIAVVAAQHSGSEDTDSLGEALGAVGLPPTFVGRTGRFAPQDAEVAIVDRFVGEGTDRAPSDFSVIAVMTAYNEEDVIGPSIEALLKGGIGVHLIDNWSTDRTYQIAEGFLGRGLVGLERYPEAPTSIFDLTGLLKRVEVISSRVPSDWCIHHDADERRMGPWPNQSLRDALWTVQRSGFNAVDHTVLDFRPVDNGFVPGTDYEAYFRNFEFGATQDRLLQVKAWRSSSRRVALAESSGHEVVFAGRRVFPYKFLLKHYPIRSQAHGERKILVERRARWNPAERAKGWHVHYDNVAAGHVFVREPAGLIEFVDGRTERDYLVPLISGIGLVEPHVPGWALNGGAGSTIYRAIRGLDVGMVGGALRRSVLPRVPLAHRVARRLRRVILGDPQ
jgi:glycosyltransferase involved in cell wall biosynthesis